MTVFVYPQREHDILISLHPSTTKGIQKHKTPVNINKKIAQANTVEPDFTFTRSVPLDEHIMQGSFNCSKMN